LKKRLAARAGAKNFCYAGPWALDGERPWPKLIKVFLLLFLPEKEVLPKPYTK
jgi:hypothetical protein